MADSESFYCADAQLYARKVGNTPDVGQVTHSNHDEGNKVTFNMAATTILIFLGRDILHGVKS